ARGVCTEGRLQIGEERACVVDDHETTTAVAYARDRMAPRAHNGTGGPTAAAREWVTFADPVDEGRTWQIDVTFLLSSWECIFGRGCQGIWTEPTPELVHGCCTYGAHFSDKADRNHVVKVAKELTAGEWQFMKLAKKRGIYEKVEEDDDEEGDGKPLDNRVVACLDARRLVRTLPPVVHPAEVPVTVGRSRSRSEA